MRQVCKVAGCDRVEHLVRGVCKMHYARMRTHGSYDLPRRGTADQPPKVANLRLLDAVKMVLEGYALTDLKNPHISSVMISRRDFDELREAFEHLSQERNE
jgi:hypothetical protein